jgi:hypothetical protein
MRWKALHVFNASLDALLLDVIGPCLESHAGALDRAFWERHYAGGPHIRLRLRAVPGVLDAVTAELRADFERWLAGHRGATSKKYSVAHAAKLLRMEGVDPDSEDLVCHENAIVERPYPEAGKVFASEGARDLVERFRCARGPLALKIMSSEEPTHELIFRLYLMLALFVGRGRYPPGSVSFKSHWEHFAASLRPADLLQRVHASYERRRDQLALAMNEVERDWRDEPGAHPLVAQWRRLLEDTHAQVTELLARGEQLAGLGPSARTDGRVAEEMREARRNSSFVDAMWVDERYTAAAAREPSFLRPRALVNLLYDLVAAVGLSPLDKMMLCHHAYRAVEGNCGCSLDDVMRRNIVAAVGGEDRRRAGTSDGGER